MEGPLGDTRIAIGLALVALVAAIAFIGLLALGLSRPGQSRPGLVAGGLPLALLPAIAGGAWTSWSLIGLFQGMSNPSAPSARTLLEPLASLWLVLRVGCGAAAFLCVVGLVIGLLRSSRSTAPEHCSVRRAAFLLMLPFLGLLVSGVLTYRIAQGFRVTAAVISDAEDPASRQRTTAVFEGVGLATEGSGSIAAVSGFVARTTTLGVFVGAAIVLILFGLAVPGSILAWRIGFGGAFAALASGLWLLAAILAALVAFGLPSPLRLP